MIKLLKVISYASLSLILSCGMKTYTLLDKRTKVPVGEKVFINKSLPDFSLFKIIDTAEVYEEFDKKYNILRRLDNHVENGFYRMYKFYANGNLNYFTIDKRSPLLKELDPLYSGYRGIYYLEKDSVRFDLFTGVDQRQHLGKLSGTFTFKGDTMFLKRDDLSYKEIYIKRRLPPEYFIYKANW